MNDIKRRVQFEIWNNDCDAYSKLRKQIESEMQEYENNKVELLIPDAITPMDTSTRVYHWWTSHPSFKT